MTIWLRRLHGCLFCAHSLWWVRFHLVINMSMQREAPEQQRAFYKSRQWQRCRSAYAASVGMICERCEQKGIIKPGYIVHHKEYITPENLNDPEIAFAFGNLEMLCLECHNKEHFKRKRRYKINSDGRVVAEIPPVTV